VHPLEMMHY